MNRVNKFKTICLSVAIAMTGATNAHDMTKIPTVTLNNGVEMPQLGVGTFLVTGNDAIEKVCNAINMGYRLIDTAQGYGNEAQVGEAIKKSGVDRTELFITTKVNTSEMREGKVRESIDSSLEKLGTNYIDLLLIHWPVAGKVEETWKIMEEYVRGGKVRAIGVSNFNPHHIDSLLTYASIRPAINQIEIHPYMTQYDVSGYNFAHDIQTESWGPLGQGNNGVMDDTAIVSIAEKHGKTPAQIILRWHIQRGLVIMPRCDNSDYAAENMMIFDFELSPSEMEIISGLNRNQRTNIKNNPDSFPW